MNTFTYFSPTKIVFGCGCVGQTGQIAREYGKRALLVCSSDSAALVGLSKVVIANLEASGIMVGVYDKVTPNPTTDLVTEGAQYARRLNAEMVIGLGGGSSLDAAKAIAVECTHNGTAWEYLHYTEGPSAKTLPIIAIGTTAGTGSQVTPCAVITNPRFKDKSAIWHPNIFPKVAIVDPEITATMPRSFTAQTGFDAFCHNFEAYLSVNANPIVEYTALDAIKRIVTYLPRALEDGSDMVAREQMALADTQGGLTNASAGVTLPHGLGMQVGGHCPHVSHGQALAVIYPEFTKFTYSSAIEKFAAVGRIFDSTLEKVPQEVAAETCCGKIDEFLQKIGLWIGFKDLNVTMDDIRVIADCGQVLGDYKNNPRVASIDEMYQLLTLCYERKEPKMG